MIHARLSPYAVFLTLSGAGAFFFTVFATLSSVYRFETAGLDPLQLMLIGAVLETTVFLFEVPTGVVADLYSRRRSIITILAIAVIMGASSETFDRLWEAHFLSNLSFPAGSGLEPVAWFGIINAGALLLAVAATELVRRFVKTDTHLAVARTLMALNILLLASMIGFGLAGHFMTAVAFYWSSVLLRRVNRPLFAAWLNQSLTPRIRATMFSFANQMDAFGQIAGGPLLGLLASVAGLRSALATAGLLLLPATVLYLRTIRRPPGAPPADESTAASGPS